ncbi:MAG: YqjF family protein [Mariniblastus sp.]
MKMNWHDLLFMHWRTDYETLRGLIPEPLEIDTFDGTPWIGIVPFRMSGVAPRLVPSLPYLSSFPELNVRTYVTLNGKPGVWFFCLEATNPVAVRVARSLFHLPYMDAKIELGNCEKSNVGKWIRYRSTRTHRGETPASLHINYRPIGDSFNAQPDSLEHFLTSRYCLYSANRKNEIYRGEIEHEPWELREAQAITKHNTMTDWLGIELPDEPPILHFAKSTKVVAWTLDKC